MRFLALLLLALPLAPTALAQDVPPAPAYAERLGPQLATLLDSPVHRAEALALTLEFAEARPGFNLTATVAPLLTIYRTDETVQHRRAAALALAALGDQEGMERLATLSRYEDDRQTRALTLQLLRNYVAALPAREAESLSFRIDVSQAD